MKKFYLVAILLVAIGTSTSAQLLRTTAVSLDYGSYSEGLGIGFRYQHPLGDHFRLAPNFTYYFKSNEKNGWALNADLHYLIGLENEKAHLYPILGLGVVSIKYHSGDRDGMSKNGYGANVGFGAQYMLFKQIGVFGEAKYAMLTGTDQLAIGIGIGYHF